jgi:hypothetical protein
MTTLLLTNRFKINHDRIAKNIFNGYVFLIAFVAVLAVLGKCNHQDIPDVVYKARSFLPITSDTTKPMQMKPIFSQLYYRKIDTLDMITGTYLGKSLSVDASDQLKQIFFRITRELRDTTHGK